MNVKRSSMKALKYLGNLTDVDRDDVLSSLGLQERDSWTGTVLGTVGIFLLGALVGAGFGLAFAPKPGPELRSDLTDRMRRKADEMGMGQGGIGSSESSPSSPFSSSPRPTIPT